MAMSSTQIAVIAAITAATPINGSASGSSPIKAAEPSTTNGRSTGSGHDWRMHQPEQGEEQPGRDRHRVANGQDRSREVMGGLLDGDFEAGAERGQGGEDAVVAVAP